MYFQQTRYSCRMKKYTPWRRAQVAPGAFSGPEIKKNILSLEIFPHRLSVVGSFAMPRLDLQIFL